MNDVVSLPSRNPRTGQTDYQMPVFSTDEVAAVARRLRAAQPIWRAQSVDRRLELLSQFAQAIATESEPLTEALTKDTGRRFESVLEVQGVQNTIRRWLNDAPGLLMGDAPRRAATPNVIIEQHKRPYALAGIISPWNFPLILSLIDAIPALAVGCAVLIKPSEATPRFVPVLQRAIDRVPGLADVLAFVTGAGPTGEAVIRNSDVVCFTGSVRTGRRVGQLAAEVFVPVHLELGGKDPAIVCADADIAHAARALTWGSMVNAGQTCMSIERCYVDRKIYQPFVAALSAEVDALRHSYPDITCGQIGPIIAEVQIPVVKRHLEDAYAKGARAVTGGKVLELGGGSWCEPTVLVDVNHDMAIINEETFAAILPVMPFDDEDEAVRLANSTDFGLSACIFSRDIDRAKGIAARLEAGAISINDAALTSMVHDAAKQSFKYSGLGGSRMGTPSLQRFYRQQAFLINDGSASPWWFASAVAPMAGS